MNSSNGNAGSRSSCDYGDKTVKRSHSAGECKSRPRKETMRHSDATSMSLMALGTDCTKTDTVRRMQQAILDSEETEIHLRSLQITTQQVRPKWANGALLLLHFTQLDAQLYKINFQPNQVLAPTSLIPLIKKIIQGQVTPTDKEMMEAPDLPVGASAGWMCRKD